MPDQQFPAKFPRVRLLEDERFILIVKHGFPKKLSTKVLQHQLSLPYRSSFEEDADALYKGPLPLPPIQTKHKDIEAQANPETSMKPLTNMRKTNEYIYKRPGLRAPLEHKKPRNLDRERTFYPHGWPRTKSRVYKLKESKESLSLRLENSNKTVGIRRKSSARGNQTNIYHVGQKPTTPLKGVQSLDSHGNLSQSDTGCVKSATVIEIADNKGELPEPDVGAASASPIPPTDSCVPPSAKSRSPLLASRVTFDGEQVVEYKNREPSRGCHSNRSLSTPGDTCIVPANPSLLQITPADVRPGRIIQTKTLTVVNTKSNRFFPLDENKQTAYNKKAAINGKLPSLTNRNTRKQQGNNSSNKDITTRKPVLSHLCQLQDLVQVEPKRQQKPVDPYTVYLKYHGQQQVIDCSTYISHARKPSNKKLTELG